jgi:hypothetical protein
MGDSLFSMKRIHRRLFAVNDQIAQVDRELRLTRSELEYHRSINEDAQRDAAIGNYIDREEASLTRGDVRRFEKTIEKLTAKQETLLAKQTKLLDRLPD